MGVFLLAAACHGSSPDAGPSSGPSGPPVSPSAAPIAARLLITPARGSKVDPQAGIAVSVSDGTITDVTVDTDGDPVEGQLDPTSTSWHSTWALNTDSRYTVHATATDATGRITTLTRSFHTLTPSQTFRATIFEGFQKTYGVGMPVILTFDRPIVDQAAVERALDLETSKPVVGAWYWDGPSTLYFRPRSYWPAHTTVSFTGHLDGVEGSPGVYGVHTLTQTFDIGESLVAVADTQTHRIHIYRNRKLFADWPISSGKPGDDTPNGTYLTIEKHNPERMIGPGYDIQVPWSVRFTYSGDFLHDAFWSVGQQGFENVSHGCVNMSPANAETYYKLAVAGDPVTITGSVRGGTWGNGWTVWFLTWKELLKGNALGLAVQAGPDGSSLTDPSTLHSPKAKPPTGAPRAGNSEPTK